jgi:hypothetical protein
MAAQLGEPDAAFGDQAADELMARKRRRTPDDTGGQPAAGEGTANLNEIVAYNFRRARELRGLTRDEAAQALEPFLGQRLPQASISAMNAPTAGSGAASSTPRKSSRSPPRSTCL